MIKPVQVKTWYEQHQCIPTLLNGLQTIRQIGAAKAMDSFINNDLTHNLLTDIWVAKNNKLVSCAGKAHYVRKVISMHPGLYDKDDPIYADRFDTFFHELSHFAAYWYFRDHGHGMMWQVCMLAFGFEPNKCYNPHKLPASYKGYKSREADRLLDGLEFEL